MNIKFDHPGESSISPYSEEHIAHLVQPTKIHRDVYTDPGVFEMEMERIWGRAWIFIGHESQVKKPGEFYATNINHEVPVIMVRDKSGEIHVLHNRCGHKGVKLVSQCKGRTSAFRCPYHGWAFNSAGTRVAQDNEIGFPDGFFDGGSKDLTKVANLAVYRDFIFITYNTKAEPLNDYLGDAAEMLDLQDRVGSLTVGKDADLVILDGDPLSTFTKVEQTWVEGEKVFDRSDPQDRLWAVGGYGASQPQAFTWCCHAETDGGEVQ